MDSSAIETASLSEQVENALKEEILAGTYLPGQRISPEDLCVKWGVSITPVRDAIKRLEAKGLLKVVPRRGVYVTTVDKRLFKNIFDLRIALECLAVETATRLIPDAKVEEVLNAYRLAGKRLQETGDRSFLIETDHLVHDVIIEYCDNPKLMEIMDGLTDLSLWAQATLVAHQPDSYEQALPEHLTIMEAIRRRDVAAAREALRAHLQNAFSRAYEHWNGDESVEGGSRSPRNRFMP